MKIAYVSINDVELIWSFHLDLKLGSNIVRSSSVPSDEPFSPQCSAPALTEGTRMDLTTVSMWPGTLAVTNAEQRVDSLGMDGARMRSHMA